MSSLDQQIDGSVAKQLVELWGGRVPTWDEFKQASNEGRVRVNTGIATKTLEASAKTGSAPKTFWLIYGVIVPWLMFLAVPVSIVAYFLVGYSVWWILAAALVSVFLYKVSLKGACDGIRNGAELNEQFYSFLVVRGAFLFEPKKR